MTRGQRRFAVKKARHAREHATQPHADCTRCGAHRAVALFGHSYTGAPALYLCEPCEEWVAWAVLECREIGPDTQPHADGGRP